MTNPLGSTTAPMPEYTGEDVGKSPMDVAATLLTSTLALMLLQPSSRPRDDATDDHDDHDGNFAPTSTVASEGDAADAADRRLPSVGRWAGDSVYLVGDYDSTILYQAAKSYRNISKPLVEQWNEFINLDSHELSYEPCSSCR